MISEGSCDTEDWSNDAENSALIKGINSILKYNRQVILNRNNNYHNYCFYCILDKKKCSLGEHKDTSSKTFKKSLTKQC